LRTSMSARSEEGGWGRGSHQNEEQQGNCTASGTKRPAHSELSGVPALSFFRELASSRVARGAPAVRVLHGGRTRRRSPTAGGVPSLSLSPCFCRWAR